MGFERSKQTICNNFLDCADILKPLYNVMHRAFLKLKYAHGDETHGQVNHAKGKDKPVRGYFWVFRNRQTLPPQRKKAVLLQTA
jgi:hypothetical protein